jgi:hypothetical protein
MKTTLLHPTLLLAAALALAGAHALRADEATTQIAFSDPAKPGTLKIRVMHGDVTVRGADVKEIAVKSESSAQSPTPRKDGMRVLSSSSGYALSEKGNVATLEYNADGWAGGSANFDITVPRSTSVVVSNSLHGDFECTDVSGDVDVKTMGGDVTLDGISGGALVETMSGEIKVHVKSLAEAKPLSFTSMHGEITIHLPADAKANVRFRTHRGVILTNFDDKALVTKTEISHGKEKEPRHRDDHGDLAPIAPVAPVAPAAGSAPAAPAAPEAPVSVSVSASVSDDDWHAEVRDSVREAVDEAAMAAHDAIEAVHESMADAHMDMSRTVPPLTGGKVVSGTLNGGGVEIQAATMTGDIVLKKAD